MTANRLAWRLGVILLLLVAASQLVRPPRTNPPVDPQKTLDAVEHPPRAIAAVLDTACGDCHTNRTTWPWYSNVAPISWLVIDHVNDGRRHLSFSDWGDYDAQKRVKELNDICKTVQSGDMPLESYLLIHRDARLSDQERSAICDWTRSVNTAASDGPAQHHSDVAADSFTMRASIRGW